MFHLQHSEDMWDMPCILLYAEPNQKERKKEEKHICVRLKSMPHNLSLALCLYFMRFVAQILSFSL